LCAARLFFCSRFILFGISQVEKVYTCQYNGKAAARGGGEICLEKLGRWHRVNNKNEKRRTASGERRASE
jgi:hypothetical protein